MSNHNNNNNHNNNSHNHNNNRRDNNRNGGRTIQVPSVSINMSSPLVLRTLFGLLLILVGYISFTLGNLDAMAQVQHHMDNGGINHVLNMLNQTTPMNTVLWLMPATIVTTVIVYHLVITDIGK